MTNMTRRNFLKSAGVMTLAVAAAGVLSGCNSSKNPVMADVKVQYWRKSNFLGNQKVGNNDEYDETVSVVKSGKVKKEQQQKLAHVMVNTGYKLSDSTATEFDVDWTQEPPVAKVWMELRACPERLQKSSSTPGCALAAHSGGAVL